MISFKQIVLLILLLSCFQAMGQTSNSFVKRVEQRARFHLRNSENVMLSNVDSSMNEALLAKRDFDEIQSVDRRDFTTENQP